MTKHSIFKIILVGGGTMGPVSPLLAIADHIYNEKPETKFLLVGTYHGPEKKAAHGLGIDFKAIFSGKLRRYFSLQTLWSPFAILLGFLQSLFIIVSYKPNVVVGAGGFVQVPLMYAAWVLRIPILIHQQDVERTLSNSLCAPIATKITVTFEHSIRDFSQGSGLFSEANNKVLWAGNPVRFNTKELPAKSAALKFFKLHSELPVVLITGGSSGAEGLNKLVEKALPKLLSFAQIIHTTGKPSEKSLPNYHPYKYIERMDMAYAAADVVISRAGLSAISELSVLHKPAIIIPMPKTHQESNAAMLWSKKAAIVFDQDGTEVDELLKGVRNLLLDGNLQKSITSNLAEIMPAGAEQRIAKVIYSLAQ
ncbi:MAG: UDP-N-acetylglucosamine--N-acetylmuramyl-(pentapeptide) pyrophosphoryl-undecaprenol N-acetylglucosamine transferase [Candidatus Doudnabacteria bacterium]|nr:UDP-N-acetylglucosamine--N-acetylmuramyl-(pentapeptide) pyrophosphoryl-undecaprenol N-acetylglucosamine transferase [Candidatus Doudnabacteria bacterium]